MPPLTAATRRELGMRAAHSRMFQQDKVWSKYSNDKVDIAHTLARVIRTLCRSLPLGRPLAALSLGSSNEPQFRVLESIFRGGLYLVDIEESALDVVAERIARQATGGVVLVRGDFTKLMGTPAAARRFRAARLRGQRMTLVTLHHSLYYARRPAWPALFEALYREILARPARGVGSPSAAIHAVLMAARSADPSSTTWLYNYFAGRFCGARNEQDLRAFAATLARAPGLADARVRSRSSRVEFFVDDFERLMGVVWMILLYPNVHRYTREQMIEIIEHVYERLWRPGRPLVQVQDHLVCYRGRRGAALG
ncbi:MAG TPA: class I SAM-dependent methyltransferase [Methylomirabilota bacterium]|nr:class I SAM-dependent methyltransferase [Methylomirabilota bacterium]